MKIRHGVILSLALFIGAFITYDNHVPIGEQKLTSIVLMLWLASIILIIYLIIRNVFRAIKGAVTGVPQGGDYQSEARRACEKVTPKKTEQEAISFKD